MGEVYSLATARKLLPVVPPQIEDQSLLKERRGAYCSAYNLFEERLKTVLLKLKSGRAPTIHQCAKAACELIAQTSPLLEVLREESNLRLQAHVFVITQQVQSILEHLKLFETRAKDEATLVLACRICEIQSELLRAAARPFFE